MLLFSSAYAGKRETKTIQVGDEFTVYTTPQNRMKNIVWEWDYNVLEAVGSIGAYSTSAKFRAKKASPSAGVVIQATTYYYVYSGSYTYVAKDFDSYTIHVNDNTTVSFAKSEYEIEYETPGQSSATYIEAIPSNSSYAGGYKWIASDYDYIYLNGDGKRACIHPRKVGQTTLTVTLDNGKSAQCRVRVTAPKPQSVDIDSYLSLIVGSGQSLKPSLSPSSAETTYSWTSDDSNIASVSSSGYVTGKSVGSTYVRVRTANGKTDACQVTVSAKQPESVSLPESISMVIGDSQTLDAVVRPADASYNLTWKSSDENVAIVSDKGKVTAISKGSAEIMVATQNGKYASCHVIVVAPLPTSIALSSDVLSLYEGQESRIDAVVFPPNAEYIIEWVSSNENVAIVSDGVVLAKQKGECVINAKSSNGLTAECSVTVLQNIIKPESISIPTNAQLIAGESLLLVVTILPSDAETVISWLSSDRNVALVNDGTVNAVSEGECVITATEDNGKTATCTVCVSRKAINPTSITIPETIGLEVGESQTIHTEIIPSEAETTLTWTSSNPDIASVDNGVIAGIKPGRCILKVTTENGIEASCTVTVNRPDPLEVSISEATLKIVEGEQHSISACVYPSDAEQSVDWSSDNETVAVISNSGLVTALSQGCCIITATTSNGKSATCIISVTSKIIKPISITIPETIELEVGDTQNLYPEILPSDAETYLLWWSSDNNVATVENGYVSALATGRCRITAKTDNGLEASCEVTVIKENDPDVPIDNNVWTGTYSIKSHVAKYDNPAYDYPSEYSFTIDDVEGKLYVTSLIGLDCTRTYPYTGIPIRIESETSAILELDVVNDAGSRTNDGEYIGGLLLLSANSEYRYNKLGNISISKTDDGGIHISDFYVFFFGLDSDYEYRKDAFYSNNGSSGEISTGLILPENDGNHTNEIEIFNLKGSRVYKGAINGNIQLKSDIYIIRRGNKTIKTLIR